MFIDMPYFMYNADWYYFDQNESRYKLTSNAPDEAIKSYREFYSTLKQHPNN